MIRSFYEKKIAYADYVLADHMVSAIKDNTDGEYAPYHFVDTEQEFQTLVKGLRP